jgi:hypothetical protein
MTLPRTVGAIVAEHTTLDVESIDRVYLNVYVPQLQHVEGVVHFFVSTTGTRGRRRRSWSRSAGNSWPPSTGLPLRTISPMITFEKGQRKDDVMAEYLRRDTAAERVLFVGKAQEKAAVVRTERRRNARTGQPYPWLVRSTAMVNHFYFYVVDATSGRSS